ncbi:MAG: hypothetical protein JKX73_09645, partial [Flavobacteriales bacterium]|nr:hypothetical protein [Flavobacteriales bacterium]
CATISLLDDGIVYRRVKDESFGFLPDAKKIVGGLNSASPGRENLVLFDPGKYSTINMEACKYLATKEAKISITAKVGIVHSLAQWLIPNFFIQIHRPTNHLKFLRIKGRGLNCLGTLMGQIN